MRSRGIQSLPLTTDAKISLHSKRKSTKYSFTPTGKTLLCISFTLLFIGILLYTNQFHFFETEVDRRTSISDTSPCQNQTQREEDLYLQIEESQTAVRELETLYEARFNQLRERLAAYERKEKENLSKNSTTTSTQLLELDTKVKSLEKNRDLWDQQNQRLKAFIAETDKKRALEKYGPGPHRVEFVLDFPPTNSTPPGSENRFVIEMAPLNLMPHTVYLFLEQVRHGLFNGTSFHRNAGHVVQGGPVPYYKNPGEHLLKRYRDFGLESVAFQEYHPQYPHVKYTLGYAGRPAGTDFYVSLIDNTLNHGPGGQTEYAIPSEADPCFAKIVEGFEAVNRMAKMPVQPGGYQAMKDNVGILYARLLESAVTKTV